MLLVKAVLLSTRYFMYVLGKAECFLTLEITGFVREIQYKRAKY